MLPYEHVRVTMARLRRESTKPGPAGEAAHEELVNLENLCRADTAVELPPIVLDGDEERKV
jgi:hypothetical protein